MFHQFQESKNFMHERGTSRFLSNFFCGALAKTSSGNPSVFQKYSDLEKFFG